MSGRIDKDQLIVRITQRTGNSAKTVEKIVNAALDELYLAFKQGESVTLRKFGSFYVRPEQTNWVFKFNPAQRLRALFGWTSTYKGEL